MCKTKCATCPTQCAPIADARSGKLARLRADLLTAQSAGFCLRAAQKAMARWRSSNGLTYEALRRTDRAIGDIEQLVRQLQEAISDEEA